MIKSLLLRLAYLCVRLLASTYRFETVGASPPAGGYLLAIWHQNLFAGILAQTGHPHVVIVSRSRDGDPVAFLCQRLGHRAVRGSSAKRGVSKGGKEAKDEMIEVLKSGLPGAVTVDGPRGPAFEVKPGIIEMARLSGLPIVPYAALPARRWVFSSWDAFRLPKPWSRIAVRYGTPIAVPPQTAPAEFAGFQQRVADGINALDVPR